MKMTKRFKMYKKGKQWVTMAVIAFATASFANSLMITSANADDTTTSSTTTSAPVSKQTDDSEKPVEAPAISAVRNGQVTENGATYYYDNGQMKTNYFQSNNGKMYYYGQDGKMYQDKFYSNWGNMYYFGKDGARYTNQYYQNWGNTYYFGEGGVRYTNRFQNVDGKMFYYDQAGVQYRNKFYSNWGNMYYFGADGARYTNQYYQNWGNTYYFGEGGVRYTNRFQSVDGKMYYYGQDGVQYRNRFYSNWGNMYYFGADGVRYTNKEYDNWGNKYYFGAGGVLAKNTLVTLQDEKYYANNEGVLTKVGDFSSFNPDKRYMIPTQMGSETTANNKYIILHEVGAESGAATNAAYLSNLTKQSYNNPNISGAYSTFVVGDGGKTYQLYQPGMVSWAAGGANSDSPVQIELGRTSNAGQFWKDYKTYVNLARTAAMQFGIPLTLDEGGKDTPGIKTHNWVTHNVWQGDGHVDPYGYLKRFGVTKERLAHDLKYGI